MSVVVVMVETGGPAQTAAAAARAVTQEMAALAALTLHRLPHKLAQAAAAAVAGQGAAARVAVA
jgi:hypothetical protein